MDEGLIQFLVIAVIVIISMMDGAARKRRKEAQRLGRLPTPDGLPEVADDLSQVAESSEGMVPEDLWEEIAALARGEVPGRTHDADPEMETWTAPQQDVSQARIAGRAGGERGRQSPERYERLDTPALTRTRPADLQGGYLHPDQAVTHKEHAQVASPTRPLPEELPHEFVPHAPEQPSKPQKELRRTQKPRSLLSGVSLGARRSLRDAIIVAEVLSPPVSLRDSDWKPLF